MHLRVCLLTEIKRYKSPIRIRITWEEHLKRLEKVLFRLEQANLTVNLSKSDFVKAKVIYLGYVVGHGVVTPIKAKVKSIINYPIPENMKSLMRCLGMAGYYRKFCKIFSEVTAPLTDLLKKDCKISLVRGLSEII